MKKHHANNHYIQKAFAKSWSDDNGDIKYIFDGELERKKFNINDDNKNHPISKKYFYSKEIETSMNEIENDGFKVVKKIIDSNKSFKLLRHEIISLKFYLILSSARTDKYRHNIEEKTGDSLFNWIMSKENKSAQNIQEEMIKKIIKLYKEFKNDNLSEYLKEKTHEDEKMCDFFKNKIKNKDGIFNKEQIINFAKSNDSSSSIIFYRLKLILESSYLLFVKFDCDSLLLSDANSFCEYYRNKENPLSFYQSIYEFYPLSPSIGVIVYNIENSFINNQESIIFKNSLKDYHSINEYKNQEEIEKELSDELEKINNDDSFKTLDNKLKLIELSKLERSIIWKHKSKDDEYNYVFMNETKEVCIMCNAMMLIHNKNNIIIYRNYNDVIDAKKELAKGYIYRKEDYS